jgi:hypothetical protein
MTESGKTTLAKRLCGIYQSNDVRTGVLDSLNDPGWPCDFQTTDPDEFLRIFWGSRRCAFFIDEAGDAVGRYNTIMQRTATRGRHWGHSVHFISQRGVQIAPTVRDQCGHLFLLTSSIQDGKVHSSEWNKPELMQCNSLAKGNYYHCTRFGVIERGSLFGAPWSNSDGTNTDTGNGRRNLRRGKADAGTAPQAQDGIGDADSRPGITDSGPGDADSGPGDTGSGPASTDNGPATKSLT